MFLYGPVDGVWRRLPETLWGDVCWDLLEMNLSAMEWYLWTYDAHEQDNDKDTQNDSPYPRDAASW